MQVEPGSVVMAPLGPRQVMGIVWEADRLPANEVPDAKLRPLLEVLPVAPLSAPLRRLVEWRSEEHTSELQSLMRISYAVFCLKKKTQINTYYKRQQTHHESSYNTSQKS